MQDWLPRSCGPSFTHLTVAGHTFRVARWRTGAPNNARPLLFFTGIGANVELLAPFLEQLRGRDIVTFDMPGIGGSPDYGGPYRLEAMANAAQAILSDLGMTEVDVMGVSWGGMLAQEFAYRHKASVGRVILAATSAGMPMIPGNPATLLKMIGSRRYADAGSIAPYLQTLYGGSGDDLETYASRMSAPSSSGYLHQLLAIVGWTSLRKATRIFAPTLILMGEEDRLVPTINGDILRFLIPGARMEVIGGGGHLFVLTHRQAVARTIEDFLDKPQLRQPHKAAGAVPLAAS